MTAKKSSLEVRAVQFISKIFVPVVGRFSRWNGYLKTHMQVRFWLSVSIVFALFWVVCFKRLDPDFGWHLRAGQYILSHHAVPGRNLYSYTAPDFRWIDHEWGNDVVTAWLYARGGYAILATLFAGLWTAGLALFARRVRFHVMLIAAVAFLPYIGVRPLAWTALLFALLLVTLDSKDKKYRQWLPLLFILWANIHAGFVAGLAVIAYYFLRERRRSTLVLLVACAAATLVNAYGIRIYEEVLRTIFDPALHKEINEWHSFSFEHQSWLFVFLWATGSLIFLRDRIISLSRLLLLTALSASRNLPLFVISALPELDDMIDRAQVEMPKKLDGLKLLILSVFVGSVLLTTYGMVSINVDNGLASSRESGYPVAEIKYLRQHACQGNLFNSYDAGGYLIWKLPNQRVYIDGRMPTWHPYMDNYEKLAQNPAKYYQPEFKKYDIHCALVDSSKFVRVLSQANWQTVSQGDGWTLLTDRPEN